ncbi:MAG: type IV secretion system protein [bacterium]
MYMDIGNIMSGGKGGFFGFIWTLKSAVSMTGITVVLYQIILLVIACVVFGTIILIQVYIAIALITGYIFVPFMIFKPLEFLWNGWLKFLIVSCLSYFLMYIVIGLMGGVLNAVASSAGYAKGSVVNNVAGTIMSVVVSPSNPAAILGFLFVLAIFAYLFLKIPSIAGEIVSGMPNISFSGAASVIIGAASIALAGRRIAGTAAKTAGQVAKVAGKGGDKK